MGWRRRPEASLFRLPWIWLPAAGEAPDGETAYTRPMPHRVDAAAIAEALRRQADPDEHERGLIRERLGWSPDERLEANAALVRFYLSVRSDGPLLRD